MALQSVVRGDNASSVQTAQEQAVGITAFVGSNAPGFSAILKQRYTDFLVNEILPNGTVLHLSDTGADSGRKRKREEVELVVDKKQKHGPTQPVEHKSQTSETKNGIAEGVTPVVTPGEQVPEESKEQLVAAQNAELAQISAADKTSLNTIFGEKTATAVLSLYASVVAHPERKPRQQPTVISEPFTEKSKRTEAHMCVRRIFDSKLETVTVQDSDTSASGSVISIKAAPARSTSNVNRDARGRDGQPGKQNWADLGGEYLHFSLYKENKDTMEVLYFLASQLKMHMKHFSFAGTKDRRGVTVQRVAIHRVKRERIEHLNRLARGWRLGGPWEYRTDPLDLGMLCGNEFVLTLRDACFDGEETTWDVSARITHARAVAEASAKRISEFGFLNYYGLQRFGSYATGTHVVGMRMLKGDLKGAIDAILSYDPAILETDPTSEEHERKKVPHDDIARASGIAAFVESEDSRDALAKIPTRFSAERSLVTHLGKYDRKTGGRPNKNDFQGALMSIQRNLRLMYVHAYQSFVWNTIAGKRWNSFGDKTIEGDLVVVGEKQSVDEVLYDSAAHPKEDEHGEPIIHPSASANHGNDDGVSSSGLEDPYVRARPLTKSEAESGHYNIFDVVLPLPGYDVLYPSNDIGKFYVEFMSSEHGGGLDPHDMRRAWKDISLSGGYRKMMARPLATGVEVDVKAYAVPEDQMVETDLERLEKIDQETTSGDAPAPSDGVKNKLAVIFKLQLGSSQYATMALRELTKGGAVGYRPEFSTANR